MLTSIPETAQIALLTASIGFLGALLGAIAAVIGPWWIKRYETNSERHRAYIESRRIVIIEYANSRLVAMQEFQTAFRLGGKFNEATQDALRDANQTSTILFSLIKKEDSNLKNWINKMQFKYLNLPVNTLHGLATADAFLSTGIQYLLAWHAGEIRTSDLQPFGLNRHNESVWLESWDTPWPPQ